MRRLMIQTLRKYVRSIPVLRNFLAHTVVPCGLFDSLILRYPLSPYWLERIRITCSSPDNALIPRAPDAGRIRYGKQTMHNGLRIYAASYYGFETAILMHRNRGVHEPQEEYAFAKVLSAIQPGGVMIECGAFWGWYSLWFNSAIPNATNFLLEPSRFNLESGRRNFRLNKLRGHFRNVAVGSENSRLDDGTAVSTLDAFANKEGISHVHLLHADIQGHEVAMLQGAHMLFSSHRVDWTFISTHSDALHDECLSKLGEYGYQIKTAAKPEQSYSEDGIIVACRPGIALPASIRLSLRKLRNFDTPCT